jgi:hypothetical protein
MNSHWLRVSWTLALGLNEGSFGPHFITFSMDGESIWNHMASMNNVDHDHREFFGMALKGRPDGICGGNWGLH